MGDTQSILVGWDGSAQSRQALEHAISLAKEKGLSKITAAYAVKEESAIVKQLLEDYEVEPPRVRREIQKIEGD